VERSILSASRTMALPEHLVDPTLLLRKVGGSRSSLVLHCVLLILPPVVLFSRAEIVRNEGDVVDGGRLRLELRIS